jgi:hypothetical protein
MSKWLLLSLLINTKLVSFSQTPESIPKYTYRQEHSGPGDNVINKYENKYETYNIINRSFISDTDRTLLYVAFSIADGRFDSTLDRSVRDTCEQLHQLCMNCLNDLKFYRQNIHHIGNLLRSIFMLQQSTRQQAFNRQLAATYLELRKQNFLTALRSLTQTMIDDSSIVLIRYLGHETKFAWTEDSTLVMTKLVNENIFPLLGVYILRAGRTTSTEEIELLYYEINAIIQASYQPDRDDFIARHLSQALRPQFEAFKSYLSNFLLEGYKDYIVNRQLPKKPIPDDVKRVYEFILAASPDKDLERNMVIAQAILVKDGILNCAGQNNLKFEKGWNWWNIQGACRRVFIMLTRNANELKQLSLFSDTVLSFNSPFFSKGKESINLFNQKFITFSKLQRLSSVPGSIFTDELLSLSRVAPFAGCGHLFDAVDAVLYRE